MAKSSVSQEVSGTRITGFRSRGGIHRRHTPSNGAFSDDSSSSATWPPAPIVSSTSNDDQVTRRKTCWDLPRLTSRGSIEAGWASPLVCGWHLFRTSFHAGADRLSVPTPFIMADYNMGPSAFQAVDAFAGHAGITKLKHLEPIQTCKPLKAGVGDGRILQAQLLQSLQFCQASQALVGDLRAVKMQIFQVLQSRQAPESQVTNSCSIQGESAEFWHATSKSLRALSETFVSDRFR